MTRRLKRTIKAIKLNEIVLSKEIDRMEINEAKIEELARSIEEIGLLQPILLREKGEGFELIAGHRRLLACEKLELTVIDAVVTRMSDADAAITRATENLARENLTPIEEANIFANLVAKHKMTVEEVAKKFGYNAGTVLRRMDLNKMPPQLREAIHLKRISVSVAEALWPINDMTDLDYYLSFAVDGGCTKDVARAWCKEWRDLKRRKEAPVGDGGHHFTPSEPRPVYVPCDTCLQAMEIGKETVLRICKGCAETIAKNL